MHYREGNLRDAREIWTFKKRGTSVTNELTSQGKAQRQIKELMAVEPDKVAGKLLSC